MDDAAKATGLHLGLRGRCLRIDGKKLTVGPTQQTVEVQNTEAIRLGDIIEVRSGQAKVLTPNRAHPHLADRIQNPRRQRGLKIRAAVESGIREFFGNQDFLETRTPLLVPCPGMEPHIRTFEVSCVASDGVRSRAFLPTSPEFAMKRLLVGGLEKIFQITPAFRAEPLSTTHHPEFTLLEWYRAYATDEDLRRDTENLVAFLATKLFGEPKIRFQGKEISVRSPWPRLAVRDLFLEKAGVDLVKASSRDALGSECKRLGLKPNAEDTWDDLYFRIWLNEIEPQLPADQAVFVTRYPASQAALAVLDQDPDGTTWAKRFEVYAGGLELGNAFEELTNPDEQEKRFNKDMELRKETYGEDFPACPKEGVDDFLQALREGMPPSAGIAVGVDRLVMLLADEPEIDYTVWLRPSVETASSERS